MMIRIPWSFKWCQSKLFFQSRTQRHSHYNRVEEEKQLTHPVKQIDYSVLTNRSSVLSVERFNGDTASTNLLLLISQHTTALSVVIYLIRAYCRCIRVIHLSEKLRLTSVWLSCDCLSYTISYCYVLSFFCGQLWFDLIIGSCSTCCQETHDSVSETLADWDNVRSITHLDAKRRYISTLHLPLTSRVASWPPVSTSSGFSDTFAHCCVE